MFFVNLVGEKQQMGFDITPKYLLGTLQLQN